MHRSMCPADVLTPEAAKLHGIIVNLDQQLEAEVGGSHANSMSSKIDPVASVLL